MWNAGMGITTATGPSAKLYVSSIISSRHAEMMHQQLRKLRSLPFLFVLEIDEGVPARGRFLAHDVTPACDVIRCVPLVTQTKVRVIRRDDDGRGQAFAVGNTQGKVARAQAVVDLFVQPGLMTELECCAHTCRERIEKRIKQGDVFFEVRRKLK